MNNKVKQIKDSGGVGVKGTHVLSVCDIGDSVAIRLQEQLESVRIRRSQIIKMGLLTAELAQSLWQEYRDYLGLLHKTYLSNQVVVENITVNNGRAVLAQRLANVVTYSGIVNYGALGTDNTGELVTDSTLGTEVYRKALSSGTVSGQTAYLENFYTTTEVSGTFEEYGFFIDGTAAADSGRLLNRFTDSVTKSALQSLNVASTIVLSDV